MQIQFGMAPSVSRATTLSPSFYSAQSSVKPDIVQFGSAQVTREGGLQAEARAALETVRRARGAHGLTWNGRKLAEKLEVAVLAEPTGAAVRIILSDQEYRIFRDRGLCIAKDETGYMIPAYVAQAILPVAVANSISLMERTEPGGKIAADWLKAYAQDQVTPAEISDMSSFLLKKIGLMTSDGKVPESIKSIVRHSAT